MSTPTPNPLHRPSRPSALPLRAPTSQPAFAAPQAPSPTSTLDTPPTPVHPSPRGAVNMGGLKTNLPMAPLHGREPAINDSPTDSLVSSSSPHLDLPGQAVPEEHGIRQVKNGDPADRYTLTEKLGSGNFGVVYKAWDGKEGREVAVKMIDIEESQDTLPEIHLEIAHLQSCASPFITRLYESFVRGWKLWIVMEFVGGGSGEDHLRRTTFTEPQTATILSSLLHAIQYMHERHKIHRDLKPANILFSDEGDVKLADLGVAAQLSGRGSLRHTFVGTPFYMAPEVISRQAYSTITDIWSIGIMAIELVTGSPPHAEKHPMRALLLIPTEPAPRLPEGGGWSEGFRDFVGRCLMKDPRMRSSAAELLQHPFILSSPPSTTLRPLITDYKTWLAAALAKDAKHRPPPGLGYTKTIYGVGGLEEEEDGWAFDTVKSRATIRDRRREEREGEEEEEREGVDVARMMSEMRIMIDGEIDEDALGGLGGTTMRSRQMSKFMENQRALSPDLTPSSSAHVSQEDLHLPRTPPAHAEPTASAEGTIRPAKSAQDPPRVIGRSSSRETLKAVALGKRGGPIIDEVVLPVLTKAIADAQGEDKEALGMVLEGFRRLGDGNGRLANKVMVDILAGFRDNGTVRAHLTRGARGHGARTSLVSLQNSFTQGPVEPVVEAEEVEAVDMPEVQAPKERNQLADLLYLRWLDGLRLKWPLGY